ncbi:MAG TPA: D-amino-acid transaminase [Nitrospira sp.]|nr:D-amino-acid transaminase [Nitrospira sp.]MBS0176431.1 D-amino-acid transaminase [Nitrospira sp.]MBX3338158.1 D-amino-acid transaminase [Nitrospira sp.]MCW5779283.1 D-amino-acid transaminase [Nitrospira sp.]HMZ56249.1 D-amino-acid transaminase [Nitrospira sp.]
MPDIACVNGRFGPLAEAVVSVEDRGFQFGDGVYEVIRTYRGRPFAIDEHLSRLERSAQALQLSLGYTKARWIALIEEGLRRSNLPETKIYLQITRGQAPRDHPFPAELSPTTVLTFRELHPLDLSVRQAGVQAILLEDIRWGRCDIKSVNLLANVLARQRAKEAGVFEAILLRDGAVTEGSVSNVMVVQNGTILTAPEGPRILSGVTRAKVLELAKKEGIPVAETVVRREDLLGASEVFLTGTTVEVLPVVRVDGQAIGPAVPGPMTQLLSRRWETLLG